jgi:LysR family hydrogen peroxide-inducible transcriptional activator
MELFQIRYFLAVAEHLSFTRAAEALHISQPPLSLQIRRLEQELGGKLFSRSSRHVSLTELGQFFEPRARLLAREAAAVADEINARVGLKNGRIRVGVSGVLAHWLLPKLLARYTALYEQIEVRVSEERTPRLIEKMEASEIDVALIRAPHQATMLSAETIATEPLCAVLRSTHPLASRASLTLDELSHEPFILITEPGEPYYDLIVELCARRGFFPRTVCLGVEYATAGRLVALGAGVTILSRMASRLVLNPALACVRIDDQQAFSPIVLLSRPTDCLSEAARAFTDLARDVCRTGCRTAAARAAAAAVARPPRGRQGREALPRAG